MNNKKYKYDFFISYKHGELDSAIALYLQQLLERYKVPKEIQQKSSKTKIARVFRDESELSASSDLSKDIEERLSDSEFLIVICSPDTKKSRWVDQEIRTFIKLRDRRNILPVLIKGEPEDSFPEILMETEPMAADFRGKDLSFIKKRCRSELLRLVSPALHCSYDELKQRHKLYQFRKIAITASLITIVAILFSAYSIYQNIQIKKNYEEKQIRQAKLLADKSTQLLKEGDKEAAVLIAMEALPKSENDKSMPFVGEAQIALENALSLYTLPDSEGYRANRILQMQDVSDLRYSLDEEKRILVTHDSENVVYFWNLDSESLISSYKLEDKVYYPDVYIGENGRAYISFSGEVICFNYEKNNVEWTVDLSKENIDYGEVALSPQKDMLFCTGNVFLADGKEAKQNVLAWVYLDAATGERLKSGQGSERYDFSCSVSGVTWSPDNNRVCVRYSNMDEKTKIFILDYEKEEMSLLTTVVQNEYAKMLCYFTDEDTMVFLGGTDSAMSLNIVYAMTNFYVQGYDINEMEMLWEVKSSAPARDTFPQIQYTDIKVNGEDKKLLTVSAYSKVINILDGEIISEASYPNEIAGVFTKNQIQFHVTDDGIIHKVNAIDGTVFNEFYGNTDLGMKDIMVARAYSDSEIFILQEDSGRVYLLNQAYDDTGIVLENSGEVNAKAAYDASGQYILGVDAVYGEKDNHLYLWDSSNGKVIFEDVIELEENEYTGFAPEFINEKYFYYATDKRMFLYSLETKKLLSEYSINELEGITAIIDTIEKCDAEEPEFYIGASNGLIVHLTGEELESEIFSTKEGLNELFDDNPEEYNYYQYEYRVSKNGKYMIIQRYEYYGDTSEIPLLAIDLEQMELLDIPSILLHSNMSQNNLEFSEDGSRIIVCTSDYQLKIIDLANAEELYSMEIDENDYHKFWLSPDNRYLFLHTSDRSLKMYDLEKEKYIMNSDAVDEDIKDWKFFEEGKYMLTMAEATWSYPICTVFQKSDKGTYEVVSGHSSCVDASLNQYMVDSSPTDTYIYNRLSLDEMLKRAEAYLNGRTLTELERQKYHIDN